MILLASFFLPPHLSLKGRRRGHVKDGVSGPAVGSSRRENYVVIVDERKIKVGY